MVYDTLFAMDDKLRGQAADGRQAGRVSDDKLTWTFTLRDGLEFHDGKPVTAEDCVASIKRWAARDSMGQKLMDVTAELEATDAKTFKLMLKEPYGLVLESLGKPAPTCRSSCPSASPSTDPNTQITEAIGSGPFIFMKDEWKPGEKHRLRQATRRTSRAPSRRPALAGGKVAKVDRVEWICDSRPADAGQRPAQRARST